MQVKKIHLENYRNISLADIEFSDGVNVIEGMNAQGKTNLLESIYYMSLGRSFRHAPDLELIKSGEVRAFVEILSTLVDIPIEFYDERMTTMVAYRYLGATETYGKKRKESVDTLSAEIILQDYLSFEKNKK